MAQNKYTVTINVKLTDPDALKKLGAEMERIRVAQQRLQKGSAGVAKQSKKTQIQMRQSGRGLQNFSYQMQDIIVQTSGGVDVFRSLSQQLPQMMINMGALGAVVGVAAAALPLLFVAMKDTETSAEDLGDAIVGLNSSIDTFEHSASDFALSIVQMRREIGEQGLIGELQRLNKELESNTLESWIGYLKTLAIEAPNASEGLKAVAAAARNNETAIEKGIRIFAEWTEGLVKAKEAQGRLNTETEKSKNLFNLNAQDAAKVAGILRTFEDSAKTYEDTISTIRDLEDALSVSVRNADNNAEGLIDTIEKLRSSLRSLQGTDQLELIEPQGERIKAKKQKAGKFVDPRMGPGRKEYNDQQRFNAQQSENLVKLAESYTLLYDPVAAYEAELQKIAEVQGLLKPEVVAKAVERAADNYAAATEQVTFASQAIDIFDQSFTTAMNGVMMGTQKISDAFKNMAKGIIAQLLRIAAYKSIAGFMGGSFGGQVAWGAEAANGGVFQGGVQKFAKGGIVSSPTMFPMKRGMGLMGEGSGPEAIIPLSRGSDGKLGVSGAGMNVTVNNMAPGVSVQPRQTESGLTVDVVMNTLANQIRRGGNDFANAFEDSYSLGRGGGVY